jgi:hypothetical protein
MKHLSQKAPVLQRELLFRLMKETDGIWEVVGYEYHSWHEPQDTIMIFHSDHITEHATSIFYRHPHSRKSAYIKHDRKDQFVMMVGEERLFERDVYEYGAGNKCTVRYKDGGFAFYDGDINAPSYPIYITDSLKYVGIEGVTPKAS